MKASAARTTEKIHPLKRTLVWQPEKLAGLRRRRPAERVEVYTPQSTAGLVKLSARIGIGLLGAMVLALALGCTPQKRITERDRKEAAVLASEAQFAMTVREWARAEGLLAKAVQVAPQGDYWLSLGATRVRINNRAGAKQAYQAALKAYEEEAVRNRTMAEPWIKQIYVLGLLGRKDDSRALVARAAKQFPNDAKVRALTDPKEFEQMFSTQNFKDNAL